MVHCYVIVCFLFEMGCRERLKCQLSSFLNATWVTCINGNVPQECLLETLSKVVDLLSAQRGCLVLLHSYIKNRSQRTQAQLIFLLGGAASPTHPALVMAH